MKNNNSIDVFQNMPVPKAVLKNIIPSIVSMIMVLVYNLADTFFIGQTKNAYMVAAVSIATPVFLLFMAIGMLFGIGGTSLISRMLGEGKNKYYLKLIVEDRPGVLGSISSTFGKYGIGIASMMQRPVPKKFSDGTVPLVFILHQAERNVLDAALEELYTHSYVSSLGSVIRVEE